METGDIDEEILHRLQDQTAAESAVGLGSDRHVGIEVEVNRERGICRER